MAGNPQVELGETIPRFFTHWIASCFGHFLMVLLPLVAEWPHPPTDPSFPVPPRLCLLSSMPTFP